MSRLIYMISVWRGAQKYLLNRLQVQQLTAARAVCGYLSRFWSERKLLQRVGWLSIRQLIYFHTVLQAHKVIISGKPAGLLESISTNHPYRTRNATMGRIRFGENFCGESSLVTTSFKHRAVHFYNEVPASVYMGTLPAVKYKLKDWIKKNIAIDWG